MITFLMITPFLGSIPALMMNPTNSRTFSIALSSAIFITSLSLWIFFDTLDTRYQFNDALPGLGSLGVPLQFGIDGLSLFFILLTTLITPICLAMSPMSKQPSLFYCAFLFMEGLLIGAFSTLDLVSFYVFFEGVLIPMFILIGV